MKASAVVPSAAPVTMPPVAPPASAPTSELPGRDGRAVAVAVGDSSARQLTFNASRETLTATLPGVRASGQRPRSLLSSQLATAQPGVRT
jgi:hypothetical protein